MEHNSIIAELIFGIVFAFLGFKLIFQREKIVNALLSSNKVFWENLNYTPNETWSTILTNIMIPLMGLAFFFAGLKTIYNFIIHMIKF